MGQQMSAFEYYEHGLVLKRVNMFYPAIDDFRKAAHDPHYTGKAHLQIALCLRAAGRHEEAVMAFRQAVASHTFSSVEARHILYHLGQTLESLDRHGESLEVYDRIRKEDPGFRDVAHRIMRLRSGGEGTVAQSHDSGHSWIQEVLARGRRLKPHLVLYLEQTGDWMSRHAQSLASHRVFERISSISASAVQHGPQASPSKRQGQPAVKRHATESRRHPRVPVCLRSHFASRNRMVKGEGELRDLSPWGCRVTSSMDVPVGEDLECCIFPQDAANPFIIEGATVRWIRPHEFGLVFTNVQSGVQWQIAQLCRTRAA